MPNDYATLSELKAALPNLSSALSDGSQDALLTVLITRASRALDRWTQREPGTYSVTADDTRYYDGPDAAIAGYPPVQGGTVTLTQTAYRSLWIDEIADVPTSVYVTPDGNPANYALWNPSDYWVWPYAAKSFGLPYLRIDLNVLYGQHQVWYSFPRAVKIVGPFGYSKTPPDDVKQAAIMQAARWFKRAQQGYQDKVEIAAANTLVYADRLDSDIEKMVAYLRRQSV